MVVTGLHNYAMPFIRHQLGDVAVAGSASCPCGRTLPVIARVEGRTRNAFLFRDGSRVWPRAATVWPMRAFVPFVRFQLVQLDYERIELRYIADASGRQPDIAALNAYARTTIHPSVEVIPTEVETLPLGPHGKFEEFVSHLGATSTAQA
jgi:phenylacetate-CoA ligase